MLQNNKKEVTATFSFKSAHVTTSFSALHAYFFKFITKKFAHLAHYSYLCTTKLVNTLVDKLDL